MEKLSIKVEVRGPSIDIVMTKVSSHFFHWNVRVAGVCLGEVLSLTRLSNQIHFILSINRQNILQDTGLSIHYSFYEPAGSEDC